MCSSNGWADLRNDFVNTFESSSRIFLICMAACEHVWCLHRASPFDKCLQNLDNSIRTFSNHFLLRRTQSWLSSNHPVLNTRTSFILGTIGVFVGPEVCSIFSCQALRSINSFSNNVLIVFGLLRGYIDSSAGLVRRGCCMAFRRLLVYSCRAWRFKNWFWRWTPS